MLTMKVTVTGPKVEDIAALLDDAMKYLRRGLRRADGCDGIGNFEFICEGEEDEDEE